MFHGRNPSKKFGLVSIPLFLILFYCYHPKEFLLYNILGKMKTTKQNLLTKTYKALYQPDPAAGKTRRTVVFKNRHAVMYFMFKITCTKCGKEVERNTPAPKEDYSFFVCEECCLKENAKLIEKEKKINYFKHIGIYAYTRKFLKEFGKMKSSRLEEAEKLEQLRFLENGYGILVVETRKDSYSIDTKKDLVQITNSK